MEDEGKKEGVSKTPVSRITENRCYCGGGGSAGTATGDGELHFD